MHFIQRAVRRGVLIHPLMRNMWCAQSDRIRVQQNSVSDEIGSSPSSRPCVHVLASTEAYACTGWPMQRVHGNLRQQLQHEGAVQYAGGAGAARTCKDVGGLDVHGPLLQEFGVLGAQAPDGFLREGCKLLDAEHVCARLRGVREARRQVPGSLHTALQANANNRVGILGVVS